VEPSGRPPPRSVNTVTVQTDFRPVSGISDALRRTASAIAYNNGFCVHSVIAAPFAKGAEVFPCGTVTTLSY
jgi:hypothetical protein